MRSNLLLACALLLAACGRSDGDAFLPATQSTIRVEQWAVRIDTLPGQYTRVRQLIDIDDSIVILTDAADQSAWRIDRRSSTRESFGTKGDGPGEIRTIGPLVRIHRDSVALLLGRSALPVPVLSATDGRGRTLRLDDAVAKFGRAPFGPPSVGFVLADCDGRLYGAPPVMRVSSSRGALVIKGVDAVPIIRVSLDGRTVDTITMMPSGELPREPGTNASGVLTPWADPGPYAATNGWAVLGDGRVVMVDAARYRVTLVNADGSRDRTWSVPFARVRVSSEGWDAQMDSAAARARAVLGSVERSGRLPVSLAGATPTLLRPDRPKYLPPIAMQDNMQRSVHVSAGHVFIPVNLIDPPAQEHWDVISIETGERVVTLSLPLRHRLVHVGGAGLFVAWQDADDVERVLRYAPPMPTARGCAWDEPERGVP